MVEEGVVKTIPDPIDDAEMGTLFVRATSMERAKAIAATYAIDQGKELARELNLGVALVEGELLYVGRFFVPTEFERAGRKALSSS